MKNSFKRNAKHDNFLLGHRWCSWKPGLKVVSVLPFLWGKQCLKQLSKHGLFPFILIWLIQPWIVIYWSICCLWDSNKSCLLKFKRTKVQVFEEARHICLTDSSAVVRKLFTTWMQYNLSKTLFSIHIFWKEKVNFVLSSTLTVPLNKWGVSKIENKLTLLLDGTWIDVTLICFLWIMNPSAMHVASEIMLNFTYWYWNTKYKDRIYFWGDTYSSPEFWCLFYL